jgi:hypothetical protein
MDRLPFTRPFLPPKLDGWSSAAFLTNRLLSKKLLPGKKTETKITPKPIGTSPLKRLAQS